ncbi:MAG: glycogen synthase [Chloroflexia bacterium]|nr:glycogen synthase [Chloroflexia bacterium]
MEKIWMVAVEAKPHATAGGTSAVVGTLSRVLRQRGYDVRLVLPYYSVLMRPPRYQVDYLFSLDVPVGPEPLATLPEEWPPVLRSYLWERAEPRPQAFVYQACPAGEGDAGEVPLYLIGGDPYHYFARVNGRDEPIYPPLEEVSVDAGRLYTFFCRAALEMMDAFARQGWQPDIIHCHDWPTGLLPALLKHAPAAFPALEGARVALTIHNSSATVYQGGWFSPQLLHYAGLPQALFDYGQLQHQGCVNFIKGGILFADVVNTVSEGYADELQDDAEESFVDLAGLRKAYRYSGGLDYVWSQYQVDLLGIRNGIDDCYTPAAIGQGADWSLVEQDWREHYPPAEGRPIAGWAYTAEDIDFWSKKMDLKRYLQERCNRLLRADFALDEAVPLVAIRSRLVEQKGFDLILQGLRQWDFGRPVQFLVVAWGEDACAVNYRLELEDLAGQYPQRLAFSRSWRDVPEPLHYAGADMLLMPSLFEPCGLPHMMALRYGTIPIVRRTGGLADVVQDFDLVSGTGNGFDFIAPDQREMVQALERALRVYASPEQWRRLVHNALQARDRRGDDFSWQTAVDRYMQEVYA